MVNWPTNLKEYTNIECYDVLWSGVRRIESDGESIQPTFFK